MRGGGEVPDGGSGLRSLQDCDDLFSRCDLVASWSRTGTPLSRPIFNPSSGGQAQLVDAVVSYAPGA